MDTLRIVLIAVLSVALVAVGIGWAWSFRMYRRISAETDQVKKP